MRSCMAMVTTCPLALMADLLVLVFRRTFWLLTFATLSGVDGVLVVGSLSPLCRQILVLSMLQVLSETSLLSVDGAIELVIHEVRWVPVLHLPVMMVVVPVILLG